MLHETPVQLHKLASLSETMEDDMILKQKSEVHLAISERMFVERNQRRVLGLSLLRQRLRIARIQNDSLTSLIDGGEVVH